MEENIALKIKKQQEEKRAKASIKVSSSQISMSDVIDEILQNNLIMEPGSSPSEDETIKEPTRYSNRTLMFEWESNKNQWLTAK